MMPSSSSICRSEGAIACASSCWRAATRTVAKQIPDEVAALSERADRALLGEDYNTPIHLHAAPEVAGHAVNERTDLAALTAQFDASEARSLSTIC